MNNRLISLRTAILTPFILVVFLILGLFMLLWSSDYNYLVNEQGTKILSAMNANTNQELSILLSEPRRINELFARSISSSKAFGKADGTEIEKITSDYLKQISPTLPQVAVLSFGDENKNFIGLRVNKDRSFSLMLQDARTDMKLNIYENESITSKALASYEGYDPTTRPWYAPVKINPAPMWSDIYVNVDEKNEATISNLMPIFDQNNTFRGVADLDVKLSGISDYLRSIKTKGSGVLYIIDKDWKIIAHSGTEDVIKIIPGTPPTAEQMPASEIPNAMIRESSKQLISKKTDFDKIEKLSIDGKNAFALISRMAEPSDLDWRVVVVIPENDLMGGVKARQTTILLITMVIGIIGIIVGAIILNSVILPILKSANAAKTISEGNWDVQIERSCMYIYETNLLVQGFNTMSEKIRESFNKLIAAQSEIERLHEVEKTNLETLVNEKKEELTLAMKELAEKEKLASLGGLVSGIAHEINTPLGVAVSAGSLLENILQNSHKKISDGTMTKSDFVANMESMDESVAIINTNLNRASTLVKSFKQIAVNQSIEERSTFVVSEYIDAILLSLKHVLKHKRHQITVECDPSLKIDSYPGAMSQILTNLIMNSLTHGFQHKEDGEISINIQAISSSLLLTYKDNGKGIEAEILPRIFDPFFTTNRSNGGSGLGLNIIYNIVTSQLKGKITCTSQVNVGTTFKIEFPL